MNPVHLEIAVSSEDELRLRAALGDNYEAILETVLRAGAEEARDYATGLAVFSTMAELRSYRVFCLFRAGLPLSAAENTIAELFKIPAAGARRITSATLARYVVELNDEVRATMQKTLEGAQWDVDLERWTLSLPAGFVRDRLLELLRQGTQPDPKLTGQGALWALPDETYAWLREKYKLPTRNHPK